jgi:hypothetical protein
MNIFKILNIATGKFSKGGGSYGRWGNTGKSWNRKSDLSSHLTCTGGSYDENAVIVEYEIREVARYSIRDWKNGIAQRRNEREQAEFDARQRKLAQHSISVGDVVVAKEGPTTSWLCSGCSSYDFAICCSTDPFVLVSEGGDMRWAHLDPKNYRSIGKASVAQRSFAFKRYYNDYGVMPTCV